MSGLAVLALLSSPALSHAGDVSEIEKELAVVAKQISSFLKRYDKNTVAVGQFTSPPQLNASAGPGITKILADELIENGIDVKKLAELGVKGEYRLTVKGGPQGPQAQIRGEVEDLAGKKLFSFTRSVRGEATLAYLFGLTVNLPASESDGVRGELLVASVTMPQTRVKSTRVSAGSDSPYALEILVKQGDDYVPKAPTENDGLAFVKVNRGEVYAVKVINDSDTDAAVTLTVDGLNMFAFSENADYRYVIVRKKSQGVIPGWHITNRRSDSFKVTEYAKSAVAQLLPNSSLVGTVTATFAAAWPRETMPPADERGSRRLVMRGKDATGRGPSVETGYQLVERVVGVFRSSVSVRYTKGD